ncbi:hypothetical protein J2Z69_001826 [Paenibacillus shirakamiensis]|uniref:Beta-mannanase n=1 Tax=Paenibacillus shirakamiensis TaxID=1265935 RepID=A0ABS4JGF5_9BACL|nr:beta-mannanase [Paenibacillus shirakamiensis]MBP2000795.1 hypothetical protein [Paenibacillus shirakamiensis]
MRMINRDEGSALPAIRELTSRLDEDRCTLRWIWPEGVEAVYIHRRGADYVATPPLGSEMSETEGIHSSLDQIRTDELKLYTRSEYKANNGYHDRIQGIGKISYTVYAATNREREQVLVRQPEGENRTEISTGKARIFYSIRQKGGWFSKYKSVQIIVTAEVAIAMDILCYVKKQGGMPVSKEDGTVYPFVNPFQAGRNVLPVIEIGKQDELRLFFTDGRKYGHTYALIPE